MVMNPTKALTPSRPIRLEAAGIILNGDLSIPENAKGIIVFVHGSGSSRFSSRNRAVADVLIRAQLATLL